MQNTSSFENYISEIAKRYRLLKSAYLQKLVENDTLKRQLGFIDDRPRAEQLRVETLIKPSGFQQIKSNRQHAEQLQVETPIKPSGFQQIKSDGDARISYEKIAQFGRTDVVDKKLGMKIDAKILTPIQASDLSQDLLDTLNIISISDMTKKGSDTHIVGSYRWRAHKYPGDIDMMEIYHVNSSDRDEATLMIKKELQKVADDINKNPRVRLADCKCGFDSRFDNLVTNMGTLQRSYVLPDMIAFFENEIPNYSKQNCVEELNNLVSVGAITEEIKNQLLRLLPPGKMTGNFYFEIYSILRKHRLLRWNINDLLTGVKFKQSYNSSPPYAIKIEEALKHNTSTKIDLWAKVGNRWTELTNFFVFQYGPSNEPVGFKFDISIDDSVKYDIMFYSSPAHEKNPKVAKRIWARAISHLAKCIKNNVVNYDCIDPTQYHIIKTLYPVFSLDINKVSQLISDIELMNNALDKRHDLNLSYSFIFRDLLVAIENIPQELFRVLHLGRDNAETSMIATSIKQEVERILTIVKSKSKAPDFRDLTDSQWDEIMTLENVDAIKHSLEVIEKIIKGKQDHYIRTYLITHNLHPLLEDSIVKFEYTFNYLNLPKVTAL